MKSIRQVSLLEPGGWSTTGLEGANATLPVASMTVTLKLTPAHAVPNSPKAVGLTLTTPGSGDPQLPVAVGKVLPQDGTRVMAFGPPPGTGWIWTAPEASGDVEAFRISSTAGRPVPPTGADEGNVGDAPIWTTAFAGETSPIKGPPRTATTTASARAVLQAIGRLLGRQVRSGGT